MSQNELISALVEAGIKSRISQRAETLEARGVTRQDVLLVYQNIIDSEGHGAAAAARILDAMLDGPGWATALQAAKDATRTAGKPKRSDNHHYQHNRKNTAHEIRMAEMRSFGLTTAEAMR